MTSMRLVLLNPIVGEARLYVSNPERKSVHSLNTRSFSRKPVWQVGLPVWVLCSFGSSWV